MEKERKAGMRKEMVQAKVLAKWALRHWRTSQSRSPLLWPSRSRQTQAFERFLTIRR